MAPRPHRAIAHPRPLRGPLPWLLCIALTGLACDPATKKVSANELCDAFVEMLANRLESTNSWGVTLDPAEAKSQCLKSQTSYAKQSPREFQTMARCALHAGTPSGWRMCGYPRRNK